ncbi:hypothetical protein KU06062604_1750001 [Flavobacterium psychrophilum]|nr:hypothetical protein KU06062604_1750001 [Flavobacterium psychrophilum]
MFLTFLFMRFFCAVRVARSYHYNLSLRRIKNNKTNHFFIAITGFSLLSGLKFSKKGYFSFFSQSLSKWIKKLIQIFLDKRMIIGINNTNVAPIDKNETFSVLPKTKKLITKAATLNAIPIP